LDLERATQAARRLWTGRVDRITRVEFEWSPGRGDVRYLGNGSAADLALFHTTPQGGRGIIFVETKYHEDLRRKDSPHKPRYTDVAQSSGVFQEGSLPALKRGVLQQLWLDHLLALATRATDNLDSALFVVMYPQVNQPCATAVARYREMLTPEGASTFEARTLEDVVETMGEVIGDVWKREFVARYLTPSVLRA
jgi:hypothetical protein